MKAPHFCVTEEMQLHSGKKNSFESRAESRRRAKLPDQQACRDDPEVHGKNRGSGVQSALCCCVPSVKLHAGDKRGRISSREISVRLTNFSQSETGSMSQNTKSGGPRGSESDPFLDHHPPGRKKSPICSPDVLTRLATRGFRNLLKETRQFEQEHKSAWASASPDWWPSYF